MYRGIHPVSRSYGLVALDGGRGAGASISQAQRPARSDARRSLATIDDEKRPGLSRESRRGVATEGLLRAASKAREGRYEKFKKYTIGEHTGTNREVYDIWGDLCSVSYSQIRRRLDRGMNVLDAYFKPNETSKGWGVNKDWGKVPGWLIEARESKS